MDACDKYVYCPDYDEFLISAKPMLKKRLGDHLQLREKFIQRAHQNTITHLQPFCGTSIANHVTTNYNASFIDKEAIDELIDSWNGPIISGQYKEKFHDIDDSTHVMNANKFNKNAVNWLDQKSWKVSQKLFADHINEIILCLNRLCEPFHSPNLTAYARVYFAMELLSTKIRGFERCRAQPLIRDRTLKENCHQLHASFKCLHHKLDLVKLKKIAKEKKKKNPKNNTPNKRRINAKSLAESLLARCSRILEEEKSKLDGENKANINNLDEEDAESKASSVSNHVDVCNELCCCANEEQVGDDYLPWIPLFSYELFPNHAHVSYDVPPPIMVPIGNEYDLQQLPPPVREPYNSWSAIHPPHYNGHYDSVRGGEYFPSRRYRFSPYDVQFARNRNI